MAIKISSIQKLNVVTTVLALQFYNVTKEVTIQRDASSPGLGAVLKQDGYPITYASKH